MENTVLYMCKLVIPLTANLLVNN